MEFTKRERNQLALCMARCNTCSEAYTCKLKAKVLQLDDAEIDGIVYDALTEYYHKLYGLKQEA